jgi:uncharacterized protein (DUF3820 family)
MMEWLKRLVAGDEMFKNYRTRVLLQQYRQWFGESEFPEVALVLRNLEAEVNGEALSANRPPLDAGPWDIVGLREKLRMKRRKER